MHPDVAKKQREVERLKREGYPTYAVEKAMREMARLKKETALPK